MAIARAAVTAGAKEVKGVDRRTMFAAAAATGVAGVTAAGQAATQVAAQLPAALPAAAPAAGSAVAGIGAVAGTIVRARVDIDKAALVGALHTFLTDPGRSNAPVVTELTKNTHLGLPMPILEHLLLEGDISREEVEAFVDGMLGGRHDVVFH